MGISANRTMYTCYGVIYICGLFFAAKTESESYPEPCVFVEVCFLARIQRTREREREWEGVGVAVSYAYNEY